MAPKSVGKVLERFSSKGTRFYRIKTANDSEALYPSVTSVLKTVNKPQLNRWLVDQTAKRLAQQLGDSKREKQWADLPEWPEAWVAEQIVEAKRAPSVISGAAMSLGTDGHELIDKLVLAEVAGILPPKEALPPYPEQLVPVMHNYKAWREECGYTFQQGDIMIWSERFGYAGAADAVALDGAGKLIIIDFKTSLAVYEDYALQAAAYCQAYEEMYDVEVTGASIVRLGKDREGDVQELPVRDWRDTFRAFHGVLAAWKWLDGQAAAPAFSADRMK